MHWVALAIVLVGAMFAGVILLLGRRFLDIYRGEMGEGPSPPLPPAPTHEGDDDDEVSDQELLSFIGEGVESITAQQYQEWIDERREAGLTDADIRKELANREPVVVF